MPICYGLPGRRCCWQELSVLFSGGIELSSRAPGRLMQFRGLSLLTLGLSPCALGAALWWIAARPDARNAPLVQVAVGAAIGLMVMALLLANTV